MFKAKLNNENVMKKSSLFQVYFFALYPDVSKLLIRGYTVIIKLVKSSYDSAKV